MKNLIIIALNIPTLIISPSMIALNISSPEINPNLIAKLFVTFSSILALVSVIKNIKIHRKEKGESK